MQIEKNDFYKLTSKNYGTISKCVIYIIRIPEKKRE